MKVRPGNPLVSPPPTYSSTWIGDGEGGSVAGTVVVVVLCPLVCGGVPAAPALQVEKSMTKQMKISLILVADLGTNKKFFLKKQFVLPHIHTHAHTHKYTGTQRKLYRTVAGIGARGKCHEKLQGKRRRGVHTYENCVVGRKNDNEGDDTTTKVTTGRKMKKKEGKRRHRQ